MLQLMNMIKNGPAKDDQRLIEKYGKFVGITTFNRPDILTTDIDFIKAVMIKDFNNFVDRKLPLELITEPATLMLNTIGGDYWKSIRTLVTPTFTSGKLKAVLF